MNKNNLGIKLLLLLLSMLICVIVAFRMGYFQVNNLASPEFLIKGIDISNYQEDINWSKIDTQQVRFVFLKATEGSNFKDKSFKKNWEEARKKGIAVGAYHFFTFCRSAKEQAQNFIETVPNETHTLPPVIDLEYDGNCKSLITKEEVIKKIDSLEQYLFRHYNQKPILYTAQNFYDHYLVGQFLENPFWAGNHLSRPKIEADRKLLFWQYYSQGYVHGIKNAVDLNIFNGNAAAFEKLKKQ